MPSRAVAERVVAGPTVGGLDEEPLAHRASAALDVTQLVLEGAHAQAQQVAQGFVGERLAQQEPANLLAQRPARADALRIAFVRHSYAAIESHNTAALPSHQARPSSASEGPPRLTSARSTASAPSAKAMARIGIKPSR